MKLLRYLANLGYGSRREVMALFADGRVSGGDGTRRYADDALATGGHDDLRIDGAALDPPPGLAAMLHKPVGHVCSMAGPGPLVHALLPPRWRARSPVVSPVGRLDRDTSGLLLLTDDGALLHRIISPKSRVAKVYQATLAQDLRGDEAALFAAGTLLLDGERTPLAPVEMTVTAPRQATLVLTEGRYHQVRRMFAAAGNHVVALHRRAVGGLALGDLVPGEWRLLDAGDIAAVFAPPD